VFIQLVDVDARWVGENVDVRLKKIQKDVDANTNSKREWDDHESREDTRDESPLISLVVVSLIRDLFEMEKNSKRSGGTRNGYKVFAMDFLGHGYSSHRHREADYFIWRNVEDVISVADQLGL